MRTMFTVLLGSVILAITCIRGQAKNNDGGPLNQDDLPFFDQLDNDYELRWNFNSTHIIFKTRVKTKGYIGFGISDHGSMFPSDVIIAWIEDGRVHFKDRHATGHFLPSVDASQDWHLISGSEDNQHTTITMMRLLETCDPDDMDITDGTTRLIYSYSPIDPASDNSISYHGMNRGSKSVILLDPTASGSKKVDLSEDVITFDFVNQNYSVPSADTTYSCQAIKLPPLGEKHHIIRYQPVIQKGHEKLLRHMDLYVCTENISDDLKNKQFLCNDDFLPEEFKSCHPIFLAWGIGGTVFDFPDHVGYPLGGPDDPVYFLLQTHYDNPEMRDDFVDNSGLRIHLSKQLRKHDAGLFQTGLNVDRYQIVPPYFHDFLSRGLCHESCIEHSLGDDEIYIFAGTLHSHLLGRRLVTRHVRTGTELPPILEENNYDFNYQKQRLLTEERVVKKGDSIITDCHYDSTKRSFVTYGGRSTREEMCMSFLFYYPKKPLSICSSRPMYNVEEQSSILETVPKMDFTNKTVREEFMGMIRDTVMYECHFYISYDFGWTVDPVITKPFVRESRCHKS